MAERIQGFENLNRERFTNVDRQFVDVNRQFVDMKENIDRRFEEVYRRFDEMKESNNRRFEVIEKKLESMANMIAAIPQAIAEHNNRLIEAMNITNRLTVIERQNASPSSV